MQAECSVLIVEDDTIMLGVYRQWLMKWLRPSSGVTVQFAVTGTEAETILRTRSFELTFLDLALPNKSGVDLALAYRAKMGCLVVASAFPECGKSVLGMADQVMTKPFGEPDFVSVLTAILQRSVKNANERTDRPREVSQTI